MSVTVSSTTVNPVIVIPVFNGRDSLLKLIREIKYLYSYPIMVVNDGSSDHLSSNDLPDCTYLEHEMNRGKGAALKTGLASAALSGYSHAVTLDADGQHDPTLIESFICASSVQPQSLVVGKRELIKIEMPFHRKLSNNITSLILSLRTSVRIYDSQVGYRCYPLYNSRLWESIEDGFQFESAVFFNLAKLKMKLVWQQIPVIYGTESSHIHVVKDTLKFIRTVFRSFKW